MEELRQKIIDLMEQELGVSAFDSDKVIGIEYAADKIMRLLEKEEKNKND